MNDKSFIYFILILILAGGAGFLLSQAYYVDYDHDTLPGFNSNSSSSPIISKTAKPMVTPRPTISNALSPTPKPSPNGILQKVPFTAQAPFGEWTDPRQQDGCEEASALMAVSWARGETFTLEEAKAKILKISDWEQEKFGNFHDTSSQDTVDRIFKDYFNFDDVRLVKNITADDIIDELEKGNLVVIPSNGRALGNPYFTPPGPDHHMLVVIGYDYATDEFITNDPGTRQGGSFRYSKFVLFGSVRDYPTGDHDQIDEIEKVMIVVSK